jgi:hypothetical protein
MNIDTKLVDQALNGLPYPVDKTRLVQLARQMGANDQIISALDRLPDQTFNSPQEVKGQLGNILKR